MNLTWVNHASCIIEYKSIKLITDPWIEGSVFNNSWSLLSPSKFQFEDFKDITHIWFSHEHPDHFFPPNIKKIPEQYRSEITILFQVTLDKKVVDFCKNLGFKIQELEPLKPYYLLEDFKIINDVVANEDDSWLYIHTPEASLINLNDCVFRTDKELKDVHDITGNVDILFTQFSYASWVGNKADITSKAEHASDKFKEIQKHIDVFNPKYTIPFASFVWFSHKDNYHANEQSNDIQKVCDFISTTNSTPIIFYPGDQWKVGDEYSNIASIKNYTNDRNIITEGNVFSHDIVHLETLMASSEKYRMKALEINDKTKLNSYKPFYAYVTDLQKTYSFNYKNGLVESDKKYDDCDVAFCSQNLKFVFDFDFGWSTIMVAGTFEKPINGNWKNIEEYQWIGTLNNQGKRMNGFWTRVKDRILKMI
jgi:UDP-MurNAc hydroxylase